MLVQTQSNQASQPRRFLGTVLIDGHNRPISEASLSWELQQSFLPELQRNADEIAKVTNPKPVDFSSLKTVSEPYHEQPANWEQIGEWIHSERYKPVSREGWALKNMAWQFACNLYIELKLSTKNAYRALVAWSGKHIAGLTQSKITQILSNARSHTAFKDTIPTNVWKTDRWIREKMRRDNLKEQLSRATKQLADHGSKNGWGIQSEHDKLTLRQLHNWDEGRARCGNSYWWVKYNSPGLEHLIDFGVTAYAKTGHVCSSPGCPDCALWETEKETAEWDWEAAYGIDLPCLVTFAVDAHQDPRAIKQAVAKMVKRRGIKRLWEDCFGCFVPTANGYSLQLMVKPQVLNRAGAEQEMRSTWAEVCMDLFGKYGTVQVTEPKLPVLDCAVELILKAERELFRLLDESLIGPAQAWKWFSCWIGDKPGAKGMNRIFHAPGFRNYKIELAEDLPETDASEELSPNMDPDMLDGNSSEEEVTSHDFLKTWFTLESQVKKGYLLKVSDPYLNQMIYLDLGGYNQSAIPEEYINLLTNKPVSGCRQAAVSQGSSLDGNSMDGGLSTRENRQALVPEGFQQWKPAKAVEPAKVNPWQAFSPQKRAREKRGEVTVAGNQRMQPEQLELEVGLTVQKKFDPNEESNLLSLELF